jgi:hypothetical protein
VHVGRDTGSGQVLTRRRSQEALVPVRGPLVRLLRWSGVLAGGVLAVIGGLGLRGPGLVAVGVAALLATCAAVGITREAPGSDRRAVLEAVVQAAAWTTGILLVLAGVAALAGVLVALMAGATGAIAWLATRSPRSRARAAGLVRTSAAAEVLLLPVRPPQEGTAPGSRTPVSGLTTPALGREWIRTTAALGGRLTPADRQALVCRREEALDELERRDPAGFARWLLDGPPGSDPADYVRGRPVQGDPAAGTDAA